MASQGTFSDEPLSPAGRLFIDPKTDVIIHIIASCKDTIDIGFAKSVLKSSVMVHHPRFCSLLVRDKDGLEHWRRIEIDIDQHVIVFDNCLDKSGKFIENTSSRGYIDVDDGEEAVNQYVADLSVSRPLSPEKPLWEIHLLMAHKCAVFRIHHALGDGFSLMSMLMAGCGKVDEGDDHRDVTAHRVAPVKRLESESKGGKRRDWRWLPCAISGFLKMIHYTLVFVMEFVFMSWFVCDKRTAISGGDGVELWPRKLATAKFLLDDMKEVKKAIPNTTINDVLFAVISSGLSRYLDHRTPNASHEGLRSTGVAMVNLRPNTGIQDLNEVMKKNSEARWGNKFGAILLPVYYHKPGNDPLEWLKRAKVTVDRKKHSLEAYVTYCLRDLAMTLLGPKYACLLYYKLLCNTTFTISNFMGPLERITIAGYPVSSLKFNTSSLPQALSIHMLSYVGIVEMQLLVAKDIIPDPEFMAKCFEDALLEMRMAAIGINTS